METSGWKEAGNPGPRWVKAAELEEMRQEAIDGSAGVSGAPSKSWGAMGVAVSHTGRRFGSHRGCHHQESMSFGSGVGVCVLEGWGVRSPGPPIDPRSHDLPTVSRDSASPAPETSIPEEVRAGDRCGSSSAFRGGFLAG